jgi:hypothetical protein
LWINDEVLSDSELLNLRKAGVEVTNFVRSIDLHDMSAIKQAISQFKSTISIREFGLNMFPTSNALKQA